MCSVISAPVSTFNEIFRRVSLTCLVPILFVIKSVPTHSAILLFIMAFKFNLTLLLILNLQLPTILYQKFHLRKVLF